MYERYSCHDGSRMCLVVRAKHCKKVSAYKRVRRKTIGEYSSMEDEQPDCYGDYAEGCEMCEFCSWQFQCRIAECG